MRLNVTNPHGTGRRAEAEGYRVGGKTGTAEMPGRGGYQEKSVISSFVGAFPMDAPRYVVLVMLFEPRTSDTGGDHITAGLTPPPPPAWWSASPLLPILPPPPRSAAVGRGAHNAPSPPLAQTTGWRRRG